MGKGRQGEKGGSQEQRCTLSRGLRGEEIFNENLRGKKWLLLQQRHQELGWEFNLIQKTTGFGGRKGFYPPQKGLEISDGLAGVGAALTKR